MLWSLGMYWNLCTFSFVCKSRLVLDLLEISIYKKKYLMQLGEFRPLCQMKFGRGIENHIIAHLKPTAICLCIWGCMLFLPKKTKALCLTVILSHLRLPKSSVTSAGLSKVLGWWLPLESYTKILFWNLKRQLTGQGHEERLGRLIKEVLRHLESSFN